MSSNFQIFVQVLWKFIAFLLCIVPPQEWGISKKRGDWNGAEHCGPCPAPMFSAWLLPVENFSQRMSLITEVRNAETKGNSQESLNNAIIKNNQGPVVLSQGL